jgi:hypothetical protein
VSLALSMAGSAGEILYGAGRGEPPQATNIKTMSKDRIPIRISFDNPGLIFPHPFPDVKAGLSEQEILMKLD